MGCTEIRDRIPEDRVELGSKLGFPGSSVGEESAYNAGASVDTGLTVEKEMATYSSILAWEISRTKEPGGLQSVGSQRVEHEWAQQQVLSST